MRETLGKRTCNPHCRLSLVLIRTMTAFFKSVGCEERRYVGTEKIVCQLSLSAIRFFYIKQDLVSETVCVLIEITRVKSI